MPELALTDAPPPLPAGWAAIARHRAGQDNPLTLIPAEWVPPVSALWMANFHLFATALPLSASFRILAEHGLTTHDAHAICRALLAPDARQRHRFAADLIADMNRIGADLIRGRKLAAETAARREPPPPNVQAAWNARRLADDLAADVASNLTTWNPEDCQ